ncbi:Bifunctional protein TrpGD [Dirofilaria immitis]
MVLYRRHIYQFGTLTQRLVHPTAPVLLTKNGPLGVHIQCLCFIHLFKQARRHTH